MKRIFLHVALLLASLSYAQTVPQAFNYQGIARDAEGTSLGSKTLGIKITLQEKLGNTTTDVYAETHTVTTNAYGLFNIAIGRGNASINTFSGVDFASKNITVKTEIDPNGGNNYTIVGNSELLSVPYALVAGNAGNTSATNFWSKNTTNNSLYVNNGEKVGIGTANPSQSLHIESNQTGAGRSMVMVRNTNTEASSNAIVHVMAGTSTVANGEAVTALTQYANTYSLIPNYAGVSSLITYGNGLILNTTNPSAFISFMTKGAGFENERMRLTAEGNFGIGTSTPTATLDLVGTAKFGSLPTTTANTRLLTADASGNLAFRDLSTISSLSGPWTKNNTTNTVTVSNGEKVGIGIANPEHALHIESSQSGIGRQLVSIKNTNPNNDCAAMVDIHAGNTGFSLIQHSPNYDLVPGYSGMSTFMTAGSGIILNTLAPSAFISLMTGGAGFENEKMRVTADGKIGIGTQTPTATLDVTGTAKFGSLATSTTNTKLLTADATGNLAFRDLSTISSLSGPWTKNSTTNTVTVSNGEKVGIGTSAPEWLLHLSQNASGADRNMVMINNTNNGTDASVGLTLKVGTASDEILALGYTGPNYNVLSNAQSRAGIVSKNIDIKAQSSTGNIKLYTGGQIGTTPSVERMTINSDGNIGIGTQTPKTKFQVSQGDIYLDDATKGVIMTSPNGQCWRVTVSNTGGFVSTSITCP